MQQPSDHLIDLRHAPKRPASTTRQVPQKSSSVGVFASFIQPKPHVQERKAPSLVKASRKPERTRAHPWVRSLVTVGVCAVCIATVLYISNVYRSANHEKGIVLGESISAFEQLQSAQGTLLSQGGDVQAPLAQAQEHFANAASALDSLRETLGILRYMPYVRGNLATANHLVTAGNAIASSAEHIHELLDSMDQQAAGYVSFFSAYHDQAGELRTQLDIAYQNISQVKSADVPAQYRDTFTSAKDNFFSVYHSMDRISSLADVMLPFLGYDKPSNLLFIFQNNQELRPTGGFMGSVARVQIDKGIITNVDVPKGGSYDIAGQVAKKTKAPKPLQLVNPYFSFQDTNWFPDFPTSSKEILSYYTQAGNEPVDGIIAFTPDVLINFLQLTGPISIEQEQVSADTLLTFLRDKIETQKASDPTQPKKIIAELLPTILSKAFTLPADKQWQVASLLDSALFTKDLLLYSQTQDLETKIVSLGAAGELPHPDTNDFLALDSANIAGGKTDRVISQYVHVASAIRKDDTEDTVTISRTHEGASGDPMLGTVNLSYVRLYVPQGSLITAAKGWYDVPSDLFQVPLKDTAEDPLLTSVEQNSQLQEAFGLRTTQEFGYTAIGGWIRVAPGETATVSVSYRLPFGLGTNDDWSLFLWRQPGMQQTGVTWDATSDRAVTGMESSFSGTASDATKGQASFDLLSDGIVGVTLK